MTMLDAVYVDTVEAKAIVAIRPKPAFQALFEIATAKAGSDVIFNKKDAPGLTLSLERLICVSGGDGGESNSPSRRIRRPDVLQAYSVVRSSPL